MSRLSCWTSYLFLIALQGPLLAEVCRRFISPSFFFLAASDLALIVSGLVASRDCFSFFRPSLRVLFLLCLYAFAVGSFSFSSPMLIYTGLRAFIVAFFSALVAFSYLRRQGDSMRLPILCLYFWSFLISSFAIAQVILGPGHPINILPDEFGSVTQGIGFYSSAAESEFGLFRPTSIFFHTGKFGQVAFFLGFVPVLMVLSSDRGHLTHWLMLSFSGIVATLVSGQRMASTLMVCGFALYSFYSGRAAVLFRLFLLVSVLALALVAFFGRDGIDALSDRYELFVSEFGTRIRFNSAAYDVVLRDSGLFGEGVGMYSFGAPRFGGATWFITEQGLLRLLAEWGILGGLGSLLFLVLFVFAGARGLTGASRGDVSFSLAFGSAFSFVGLLVWCFTHDVLGNALTMQMFGTLLGLSGGWHFRSQRLKSF